MRTALGGRQGTCCVLPLWQQCCCACCAQVGAHVVLGDRDQNVTMQRLRYYTHYLTRQVGYLGGGGGLGKWV